MKRELYTRGEVIANIFDYIKNPFIHKKSRATGTKIDLDLDFREDDVILSDEEMDKILECAKNTSRWMYIALLILKYTSIMTKIARNNSRSKCRIRQIFPKKSG
jgi:chromatin remodeling complex protein RSC6